jgi:oxygen-independent coproporphyrinogen-3 oxidase
VLRGAVLTGDSLGLYVHVPFCAQRCHYCSFNTAPLEPDALPRYLRALHREIALLARLPWATRVRLASVFFGGGTPSLVEPEDLAGVLAAIRAGLGLEPGAEVTVECNPESVTRERLAAYRAAGVTRVSLGVQTLDDALLARLGRLHTGAGAHAAFDAGRAAGFDNISVDLMYGLPGQDTGMWRRTVDAVLDWKPDHLSAYGLTLDAGSRWGATGVADLPVDDTVVEQYWILAGAARARGLEHYEISNYARPGFRSRHNQIYWRADEYLAAGPGACGFVGDVRYGNTKPVARYAAALEAGLLPVDTVERLDVGQRAAERLFLGLRLADGVPAAWLHARAAAVPALRRRLDDWRERGLLVARGARVALSEAGFLVSDALFVELL